MLGRSKRTISADGISPHTCLPIRHARSPQRVAQGRTSATRLGIRHAAEGNVRKPPPGCPCRQREKEELEKSDFAGVQIQFDHLEVSRTPV